MPGLSDQQLQDWYAKFAKEVYEKAQIDVTSKEDVGRIKNYEIKSWSSHDVNGAEVECTYAFMPDAEIKQTTAPDIKDCEAYGKWVMDNLDTKMTKERIRALYDQSRSGTLMIFQPGVGFHASCQVYTDQNGEIHTSVPIYMQDPEQNANLTDDQKIPMPPVSVIDPHPGDYYPGYPQEPERPANMNPGFLSRLGYYLGMDTDYAKLVRYEKALDAYPRIVSAWMDNIASQPGNAAEYNAAKDARRRYEREFAEYQASYKGKHYGIDKGYIAATTGDANLIEWMKYEVDFMEKMHAQSPREVSKRRHEEEIVKTWNEGLVKVETMLNYPNRTDDVLHNLLGSNPQPDTLTEWLRKKVFVKGEYKPEPYNLPKSEGYENMTPEKQALDDKMWSDLADIAGFAAVVQPDVISKKPQEGLTPEENGKIRFGMMLNDLFTQGRIKGEQHMDVLEPARKKAEAALNAYAAGNPQLLADLLALSLKMLNREAINATNLNNDPAINTLHLISRVYNVLTSDDKLLEAAKLDPQELQEARGSIALFNVIRQSQLAKKKILQHSKGLAQFTQEELMEAGKDILLGEVVKKEILMEHSAGAELINETQKYKDTLQIYTVAQRHIELQKEINQALEQGHTDTAKRIQEDKDRLQYQGKIAFSKLTRYQLERPGYSINQKLLKAEDVTAFKNQLAEGSGLQELLSDTPENVGKIFAVGRKIGEMAEKALEKLAKEQLKNQPQPEAEKKPLEIEQPQQSQGMEMNGRAIHL